jgi:hypothetical protein
MLSPTTAKILATPLSSSTARERWVEELELSHVYLRSRIWKGGRDKNVHIVASHRKSLMKVNLTIVRFINKIILGNRMEQIDISVMKRRQSLLINIKI